MTTQKAEKISIVANNSAAAELSVNATETEKEPVGEPASGGRQGVKDKRASV